MNSTFTCPHCGSENVQSCPIIFQSGTSGSDAVTAADKFIAVTKGVTMTNLARSVAPPEKKETGWLATAFFAFLTWVFLDSKETWLIILLVILTGASFKENLDKKNYNEKVWPALYDTWLHSYLCHRCGNVFVIN